MTRRDPETPLRWTCKSVRKLADEPSTRATPSVTRRGRTAACAGLQLAGQPETLEGNQHEDRNEQLNTSTARPSVISSKHMLFYLKQRLSLPEQL